jgi:heme oxygenase
MQETTFTEEIKQQTAPAHQALEKSIVNIIRRIDSAGEYEKMLMFFYGYYKPLEARIHKRLHGADFLIQTRQSEWLLSDIRQLGNQSYEFPECMELPEVQNHYDALAALYVLEGSTLGGIHILKMIRKRIHLPQGHADLFFNGHGTNTASNWNSFRQLVDIEIKEPDQASFLATVNATFSHFKKWADINYAYEQQEKL